jgi:hypothetical protein
MEKVVPRSYSQVVSKQLKTRLAIYAFASIALLLASIYDVLRGDVIWWIALAAIVVGYGMGYVFSRIRKLKWDAAGEKIITQWDTVGVIAIILYLVVEYGRDWLFSHWFSGVALSAITFSFIAGLLLGRLLGTHHSIQKIIRITK